MGIMADVHITTETGTRRGTGKGFFLVFKYKWAAGDAYESPLIQFNLLFLEVAVRVVLVKMFKSCFAYCQLCEHNQVT